MLCTGWQGVVETRTKTKKMNQERGVSFFACRWMYVADMAGKHTSMTKEATRAIKDLKNARKAKEERASQRVGSLC